MNSTLNVLVNTNNKTTDINDEMDVGEILPQYELKNEEFEVENLGSMSKRDLYKSSKSDFAVINNELSCEINIFGLKEIINLAESSDDIANKLCLKYDVPFLALKNIVEMKKKEVFNKEKVENPVVNEELAQETKPIQELKEDLFNIYKSHNFQNLVELSGVDNYMEKKQQSEKVFNTYTNLEHVDFLNSKSILNTNNNNNPILNKITDSKLKEIDNHSNLFTIDNLYELHNKENNKKEVFPKNSGKSSKRQSDKNKNNKNSNSNKNLNNKNVSHSVSINSSNTSTSSNINFFGERLYRKSIALASEKKRQTEKAKIQDEINKQQECSFIPKINSINSLFGSEIKSKLYEKKSEKILIPEENLEVQSKKVNISQAEADKLFSKLYREKETRDQQKTILQNEYFSQFKFSPDINEKSKPVLQNFYKRLQDWIQKKTEKEREDFEKSRYDFKTGQELFHPVISQRSKEIEKKNIWETLYRERNYLQAMKKENMTIQEKEFINSNKVKLISENSEQINNQLKNSIFNKLFLCLDNDNDKVISYNDFNSNNLPNEILNTLNGISQNIKDNNLQLSEEEFIKSMHQIDQALNYSEKTKIFFWFNHSKLHSSTSCCVNENNIEKYTFQPEPSKKSTELFNKSTKNNKDFFIRNNETMKNKEQFIMTKKYEYDAEEMKECTFSPNIQKRDVSSTSAQNLATFAKKNTANTGTIVSKNTNANTYRTEDNRIQNDENKQNFRTINLNELNEGNQGNNNQDHLRIDEGDSQGKGKMN